MKVNQETIKNMLLTLEELPYTHAQFTVDNEATPEETEEIHFHYLILQDAGFVELGEPITNAAGELMSIPEIRMTYQGNEYLQALKEKKVWEKVKNYSIETAKEVGKQLLIAIAKDQAGLK